MRITSTRCNNPVWLHHNNLQFMIWSWLYSPTFIVWLWSDSIFILGVIRYSGLYSILLWCYWESVFRLKSLGLHEELPEWRQSRSRSILPQFRWRRSLFHLVNSRKNFEFSLGNWVPVFEVFSFVFHSVFIYLCEGTPSAVHNSMTSIRYFASRVRQFRL